MTRPDFLALALALALTGCARFVPGTGGGGRDVMLPGPSTVVSGFAAETGTANLASGSDKGEVRVAVRWPGPTSRRLQVLPLSVRSLEVEVLDVHGVSLARQVIPRGAPGSVSSATLMVPVGTGYRVSGIAWGEPDGEGLAPALARGDASNVVIRRSRATQVSLVLGPTTVPAVTAITPGVAGPGAWLRLEGRNFSRVPGLASEVWFGKVQAVRHRVRSDSVIEAEVPEGARSAPLSVKVDGVASLSSNPFFVLRALRLSGPSGPVLTGSRQMLGLFGEDTEGVRLEDVPVVWETGHPGDEALVAKGEVHFAGTRSATLDVVVRSGAIVARWPMEVRSRPLSVVVVPRAVTLDARNEDGTWDAPFTVSAPFSAVVTYADGSSDGDVRWQVPDPRMASWVDGRVVTAPGAPGGLVVLRAISNRDGTVEGTASVVVMDQGLAEVVIE